MNAKGKAKDPKSCALSLACRRSDNEIVAAYFFKSTAWVEYASKIVRYKLPQSLQKEIVSFDRSKIFEAGLYQLSAICKSARFGEPQKRRAKNEAKAPAKAAAKTQKRHVRHITTNMRNVPFKRRGPAPAKA